MKGSKNKTYVVRFEPSGLNVEVPVGTNLLEAARKAGVYLSSICGGDGCCGKCKLIIDQGQFDSRPGSSLTEDEIEQNIVLACRTNAISDITGKTQGNLKVIVHRARKTVCEFAREKFEAENGV